MLTSSKSSERFVRSTLVFKRSIYAAVLLYSLQLSVASSFHSFCFTEIVIFFFVTPGFSLDPFWRTVRHLFLWYQCYLKWKVMHHSWAASYFRSFGPLSSGCSDFLFGLLGWPSLLTLKDSFSSLSFALRGCSVQVFYIFLGHCLTVLCVLRIAGCFNVYQLNVCSSYDNVVVFVGKMSSTFFWQTVVDVLRK